MACHGQWRSLPVTWVLRRCQAMAWASLGEVMLKLENPDWSVNFQALYPFANLADCFVSKLCRRRGCNSYRKNDYGGRVVKG